MTRKHPVPAGRIALTFEADALVMLNAETDVERNPDEMDAPADYDASATEYDPYI